MLPLLPLSLFCLSRTVLLLLLLLVVLLLVVVVVLLLLLLLVMFRTCEALRFPLLPRVGSRKRVSFFCTAPPVARPHRRNVSIVSLPCKA
jgi:hypothetical protein